MTDHDKRNIAGQCYADDATQRYQVGSPRPRTDAEWLGYFREHYRDSYAVSAPGARGGQWQASALFGQADQLFGWSAAELLAELHEHRFRNRTRPKDAK